MVIVGGLVPLAGTASSAQTAPASITVTGTSPAGSFSPNGDGQDDEVTIGFCLDAAANVTATVEDDTGAKIRTIASAVSFAAGCSNSTSAWDGRDDAGALAPDGTYTARLVATNQSGTPTQSTIGVVVDRRVPGVVSAPAPGATLAGTAAFALTPTSGFTLTQVSFRMATASGSMSCQSDAVTSADPADGMFRVSFDTVAASCGEGERQLTAQVWFTDTAGSSHFWTSPVVPVTLANPAPPVIGLQAFGPTVFSPDDDDQDDSVGFGYCTADDVDGGQVSVVVRVLDAAGDPVRTLVEESRPPAPFCFSWLGYYSFLQWDGLDDDGAAVTDGDYRVEVAATDAGSLTSTETLDVVVDRRAPGVVSGPANGATLVGTAELAFTPTDGFTIGQVVFQLVSPSGSVSCHTDPVIAADPDDGVFRTSFDTAVSCGDGARNLTAQVSYTDAAGMARSWTSPVVAVTLANPDPPAITLQAFGPTIFSPNADTQDDSVGFGYCTADAVDGGQLSVVVRVLDGAGDPVRTLVEETRDPAPFCFSWLGYFSFLQWDGLDDDAAEVPDGDYTIEVAATDAAGLSSTETLGVVVDRRVPGVVSAPANGATLAGTADLAFTPTERFTIAQVVFQLVSPSGSVSCHADPITSPDHDDGVFRVSLDTAASCGDGARNLTAQVSYTDAAGVARSWTSPVVPVTLANPAPPAITLQAFGPRVFSPNGDDQDDMLNIGYCTADAVDGGQLSVVARVLDEAGDPVRTLVEETRDPAPLCFSWLGWFSGLQWNGLDDDAVAVPDGDYAIEVAATDASGLTSRETIDVVVDRRMPGVLSTPEAGATLAGAAQFAFTPTDGFTIDQVNLSFAGRNASIFNASADGIWRTTYPVGQLPVGPTELFWSVAWADAHGVTHSYSGRREIAIDPTSIPLLVEVSPSQGPAPLDVDFTVTASEPNDRTLDLSVDYGDGTPVHTDTVAAPFDPVALEHTYDEPGSYQAFVSVSNGTGGYAAQTAPIVVSGSPNAPPVVEVTTSPTSGAAPLDVQTTITATDPDGDALTYKADFGDGTAAVTGTLPATAVAHRYTVPGTYLVRTEVSDGQLSVARLTRITVAPGEPLIANAGDDRAATVGDEVSFDASASRPSALITSYEWDFGDGASATDGTPTHTYANPGTYTVTLRVRSATNTTTDTATVTISPVPPTPGLGVTVRGGGASVAGANVLVIEPDGTRVDATTNGDGTARLNGFDDGTVSVYVYASGFQPAIASATLTDGSGSIDVELTTGLVGAAELGSRRLDREEIIDLGIDPDDPDNQNVYEFEINLFFVPITPDPDEPVPDPPVNVTATVGPPGFFVLDLPGGGRCDSPCSFSWGNSTVVPQVQYVEAQPIIQWLVIPGRASFLKEFFDVSLVVQNLAPAGFTFEQGSATIDLPAGLSLAPTADPQTPTVDVADIPGRSSRTTTWTVRGDAEGDYDLTAAYTGVLEPVGKPVQLRASTLEPLKVWGGSALKMTVQTDEIAKRNAPYEVWVTLENITDQGGGTGTPVYNAEVELFDRPPDAPDWQARYIFQPCQQRVQRADVIEPGQSFTAKYVVIPELGNEQVTYLELIEEQSFVRRTGGNVTLDAVIQSKPFLPRYNLETETVRDDDGPDRSQISWAEVDDASVDGYDVFITDSLNTPFGCDPASPDPAGHAYESTSAGETLVEIPDTRHALGRYYAIMTRYADGRYQMRHNLGVGPERYVALGDSFSAGEGLPNFEPATATDVYGPPTGQFGGQVLGDDGNPIIDNTCHRSLGSYSRRLAKDDHLAERLDPAIFRACSGAETRDVAVDVGGRDGRGHRNGEIAQNRQVDGFTEVITLNMGGNDAAFARLVTMCVIADCYKEFIGDAAAHPFDVSETAWDEAHGRVAAAAACLDPDLAKAFICAALELINRNGDQSTAYVYDQTLRQRLVDSYIDLATRAPNAQIFVLNYPQVFAADDRGTCRVNPLIGDLSLSGTEKTQIRAFTEALNAVVGDAVQDANEVLGSDQLRPVDVSGAFAGHELCSGSAYNPASALNSLVLPEGLTWPGNTGPVAYSFHPNDVGQRLFYERAAAAMKATLSSVDVLREGDSVAVGTLDVGAEQVAAVFDTSWWGSDVELRLTDPSGRVIDRSSDDSDVERRTTATSEVVRITDPEPGEWDVEVVGRDLPDGPELVTTRGWTSAARNRAPVAAGSATIADTEARIVEFDASGSSDTDGTVAGYLWDFGDGTTSTDPRPRHTYNERGLYQPFVTVTDSDGTIGTFQLPPLDFRNANAQADDDAYATDEDAPLVVGAPGVLANDSDADGDALTAVLVAEPGHGTVELAADGSFTYTPDGDFSGIDTFTYRANDGFVGSAPATVTITVTPVNDAPAAVADEVTTTEDTPLAVEAPGVLGNDADADGDDLSAALVANAAHGTVALAADGSYTYTPQSNFHGNDAFTYKVNDGSVDSAPATVTVAVAPVNDVPVAAADAYTGQQDQHLVINAPGVLINDLDADGDPLTAVVTSAPAHGSLELAADGSYRYVPQAGFHGSDSFAYQANDSTTASAPVEVTLEIAPGTNRPPAGADDTVTTAEDTPTSAEAPGVLANDSDPDGDALSAILTAGPAHGALELAADGSYTYVPEAGFHGNDAFVYAANDGELDSAPTTVNVTVTPVDDQPVGISDQLMATEDSPISVPAPGVLANDTDDGDALTAELVANAAHGTVALTPDGSFTYTPDANFHGPDSFTYTANSGSAASPPVTVAITVTPVNDTPLATGETYGGEQGRQLVVLAPGVLANDSDVDGDQLSATLVTDAAHGDIQIAADGSFTYTPDANFHGTDTYTYRANDGSVDSAVATVTLNIQARPSGPTLSVADAAPVSEPRGRGEVYAEFKVTLSAPARRSITVKVATVNGTAVAETDFRSVNEQVRFAPGETRKTVKVRILGDSATELQEQFTLRLTNPSGATIIDATGIGTIQSEQPPTVSVADAAPVSEPRGRGEVYAEFKVTLSAPARRSITVKVATVNGTAVAGKDFRSVSETVRFSEGDTRKTVKVRILGDSATEPLEQFTLQLTNPSGATTADATGIGTIRAG